MSITAVPTVEDVDLALKARDRMMWALGDYPRVAREIVHPLGDVLVNTLTIGSTDTVLDVAAGSGNASLPAAQKGARVTASDLTPELLDAGRAIAGDRNIDWVVADAEHLPFADESFTVVMSCIGVMFAPHHQQAADEMLRVCRPDGSLGLLSWTPEGFIGRLFATMKPFAPAPPAGVQPAPLWGSEGHLEELFSDRATRVRSQKGLLRVSAFETPEAFRDYFKENYGPTIAVYRSLGDDHSRIAELDQALVVLARDAAVDSSGALDWEYLVSVFERR